MKISLAKSISRLAALILVTVFALAVMIASGTKWFQFAWNSPPPELEEPVISELAPSPVAVLDLEPRLTEITRQYAGMVEPLERFDLAFEVAGRVTELGVGTDGQPLDDGSQIQKGQVLARLDDRTFQSRVKEVQAQLQQAQGELDRAETLRAKNSQAITDSVLEGRRTDVAVLQAQLELARKNLEDATLLAPADGVISERHVNPGESVNPHETVFEVVQVDRVLLVVGVPASEIRGLVERQREIARRQRLDAEGSFLRDLPSDADATRSGSASVLGTSAGPNSEPDSETDSLAAPFAAEDLAFQAYVEMSGRSPLGTRWNTLEGEVYRIGQTADQTLGLFPVEILLDNPDGNLRPGQIGTARIVLDRKKAFRIPVSSAVFTDRDQFFYWLERTVTNDGNSPESQLGYVARRHDLADGDFLEQKRDLILFDLPPARRTVVVKGQHRLVPGRPVKIVERNGDAMNPASPDATEAATPSLAAREASSSANGQPRAPTTARDEGDSTPAEKMAPAGTRLP